jgi:hypothetical protein
MNKSKLALQTRRRVFAAPADSLSQLQETERKRESAGSGLSNGILTWSRWRLKSRKYLVQKKRYSLFLQETMISLKDYTWLSLDFSFFMALIFWPWSSGLRLLAHGQRTWETSFWSRGLQVWSGFKQLCPVVLCWQVQLRIIIKHLHAAGRCARSGAFHITILFIICSDRR